MEVNIKKTLIFGPDFGVSRLTGGACWGREKLQARMERRLRLSGNADTRMRSSRGKKDMIFFLDMRYHITTKNKGYRKEALYTEIAPQMTVSRGKYGVKYSFFSYHSQKNPKKIAQITSVKILLRSPELGRDSKKGISNSRHEQATVSEPLLIQAEHFLYSHRCSYS
jgi:hypothetical protein